MIRGAKVDRNTLAVKLLQARHPLAQCAMAMIMAAVAAISILCLQEIF
jgi:tRNA(Arg) A34 adenosine deaminase TadA